jgi:hypothetical protein
LFDIVVLLRNLNHEFQFPLDNLARCGQLLPEAKVARSTSLPVAGERMA